ncbi:hypothetical protein BJ912DRAFT_219419 [Pholiota molesta]|nr:hypothetical protein BJ912DRAFT_219419 [Pholiota molesta]
MLWFRLFCMVSGARSWGWVEVRNRYRRLLVLGVMHPLRDLKVVQLFEQGRWDTKRRVMPLLHGALRAFAAYRRHQERAHRPDLLAGGRGCVHGRLLPLGTDIFLRGRPVAVRAVVGGAEGVRSGSIWACASAWAIDRARTFQCAFFWRFAGRVEMDSSASRSSAAGCS